MEILRSTFFVLLLLAGQMSSADSQCYDVHLNDKSIFCVKSGIGSISPQSRADVIEGKLLRLANDYTFDPQSITVNESEGAYLISGADLGLVSIGAKDIEPATNLEESANIIAEKIKNEIADFRQKRSPQSLLLGLL